MKTKRRKPLKAPKRVTTTAAQIDTADEVRELLTDAMNRLYRCPLTEAGWVVE